MKSAKMLLVAALVLLHPVPSKAWGLLGHRIVGGIAEQYLTSQARKEVKRILGNETIAMASSWADFIKSDSFYNYLYSWHYINITRGMTASEVQEYLRNDRSEDLYTKLKFLIGELKSKKLPLTKQALYLKLLIHLAGDAHQPMHAAHAEDKGGNNIKVWWFSAPSNLHRIWDENLIDFQQLSYTEYIQWINFPAPAQKRFWQQQPLNEWIAESYAISEQLYKEVHQDDKLGYSYNFRYSQMMNGQLLKGGLRLAAVLNEIFR
jgi:hypothetical protein